MRTHECSRCHRIGYQGFTPYGSEGWVCANDRACTTRAARREREAPADEAMSELGAEHHLRAGRVHHVPLDQLPVSVDDYKAAIQRQAKRAGWHVSVRIVGCSTLVASRTDT